MPLPTVGTGSKQTNYYCAFVASRQTIIVHLFFFKHEKLSETCYEVLVSIINDVTKLRQNRKVLPILDSWIENEFKFADVWRTLLFHFLKSIVWANSSAAAVDLKDVSKIKTNREKFRILSNSMKVTFFFCGSLHKFRLNEKKGLRQ